MRKSIIAGLRPFQQCFSHIRADMNDEKYIQVMISRRGLILISTHVCTYYIQEKLGLSNALKEAI